MALCFLQYLRLEGFRRGEKSRGISPRPDALGGCAPLRSLDARAVPPRPLAPYARAGAGMARRAMKNRTTNTRSQIAQGIHMAGMLPMAA